MVIGPDVVNLAFARDDQLINVGRGPSDMAVRRAHVAFLMAAQTADATAFAPDVAGGEGDVHQRTNGAVVVIAPDDALFIRRHAFAARAVLGFGDPGCGLCDVGGRDAADCSCLVQRQLASGPCRLETAKGSGVLRIFRQGLTGKCGRFDEIGVDPALVGNFGEQRVEQREIGAGIDLQMQHVLGPGDFLAGVGRDRAAWVDDHDLRPVAHSRNHVVQEQVRLVFQRVRADEHDGIRQPVVLIGIVQLAHTHVAGRMHFRIIGGPVVDAAVLDLHRPEIELARAPGVLISAGRSAMVEHRYEQVVLGVLVDHPRRHLRHKIQRIIPCRRLPGAVAPDHRVGQALLLGSGHIRAPVFRHARAADRTKTAVYHTVDVRFDHQMHVFAVLLDDVVHRRRIPSVRILKLLLAQILARPVRQCGALLVHRPSVGFVAASYDAVVAGHVVDARICGNDRQTVDLTFVSHFTLPQA